MSIRIEHAETGDLSSIIALLARSGLPEAGLGAHPSTLLFIAREGERTLGCAALELYRADALLRSVAVEAEARGRGVGGRLVTRGLEAACHLGVAAIYLLTDTAETFFARHGFRTIERETVPDSLIRSSEFTYTGCSSAAVMVRHVNDPARRSGVDGRQVRAVPGVSLRDLAVTQGRSLRWDVEVGRGLRCTSPG